MDLEIKCPGCGVTFETSENVLVHLRSCFPFPQRFPCVICPKTFKDKYCWRKHWLTHFLERKFQCSDCKSSYKTLQGLRGHQQRTCNGDYYCKVCDFVGKHGKEMTQHRKLHEYKETYSCPMCEKKYASIYGLHTHIGHFHSKEWKISKGNKETKTTNPRKCPECERVIFTQFANHVNFCNGGLKCPICPEIFYDQPRLDVHVKSHQTAKTFLCHLCGEGFETVEAKDFHLAKEHNLKTKEKSLAESKSNTATAKIKPNRITRTEARALNSAKLQSGATSQSKTVDERETSFIQNRKQHGRPKPRNDKVPCSKCGRFFDRGNVINHERRCVGPLICEKCNVNFSHLTNLRLHMQKVHKKSRNFCCKKCKKRFFTRSALTVHLIGFHNMERSEASSDKNAQIDTGPKAMRKCPRCSRLFQGGNYFKSNWNKHLKKCKKIQRCWMCKKNIRGPLRNLRNHIKRVHEQIKNHQCGKCEKKFYSRSILKRHEMIHHNQTHNSECGTETRLKSKKIPDRYDL